jgi:alpha-glucosidase
MPWSGTKAPYGFGSADNPPWLPQPESWGALTVEAQDGDPTSHLNHYRAALAERRRHPALGDGTLSWNDDVPDGVLSFDREPGFRCVVNFGPDPFPLPADAQVLVASGGAASGTLGVDEAVWLQL